METRIYSLKSILILSLLILMCSCSTIFEKITNMVEMPVEAKSYMLFISDLSSFIDTSKFELIPNKKGLIFPYCKMENRMSGLTISGRARYKDVVSGQIILFMTAISVTRDSKQALSLFNTDKKLGAFYKKSIIHINSADYKMEKAFCIQDSTRFCLMFQKERFLISFDIDNISGFSINEKNQKDIFMSKLNNAILQHYPATHK